jgi:hypothetical protein
VKEVLPPTISNKPFDSIKGKQLGVGCFGRVVQAEAVGINDGTENSVSTVAVKMVRSRTNLAAIEGLVCELKILIHLGAHVNIVNLLGACTKEINRGNRNPNCLKKLIAGYIICFSSRR